MRVSGGISIPYRKKPKVSAYIKEDIICCRFYFIVERRIVSQSLPNRAGLSVEAYKKYLLLCRREMFGHGISTSGCEDSWKRIGIARAKQKEQQLIQELVDKYFIEVINAEKHQYKLLVAPTYEGSDLVGSTDASRKIKDLKHDGNGFILIPREIVDIGYLAALSGRQLQVLLQLYSYNFLHLYGGVDPNAIHFLTGVDVRGFRDVVTLGEIDENLYQDIYLTKGEFATTLASLLKLGIIKPAKVVVIEDETRIHYVCDFTEGRKLGVGERVIQVLRPVYQIKSQVEKWNECNR